MNKNVNAINFKNDILQDNYLEQILNLFEVNDIYLCLYLTNKNLNLKELLYNSNIKQIYYGSSEDQEDLVLMISSKNISKFLQNISKYVYELVVWSCYTSWENFLLSLRNYKTPKRSELNMESSFYLDYNNEIKSIEIICDLEYNAKIAKISKIDIINILKNSHKGE